jgi:predicted aspartyl protease
MPSYDLQMDPPAPFVHVQITNPATGETCTLRAKLDTGASMSVLPESVAEELSLEPMGRMQCATATTAQDHHDRSILSHWM